MHTVHTPEPPDAHAYGHIKKLFMRIIAKCEAALQVNPYDDGARGPGGRHARCCVRTESGTDGRDP